MFRGKENSVSLSRIISSFDGVKFQPASQFKAELIFETNKSFFY